MLYLATDTPNRMPGFWANFEDMRNGAQMAGTSDPSAAPGSLSLEFTRLSQLTGDPKYHDAVDRIKDFLASSQNKSLLPGMWPRLIDFRNQRVEDNTFTLGALADSLYEYLPKMHALLGGRDPAYEAMYRAAMDTVKEHILFRPMLPEEEDVLFAGDARVTAGHVEHIPDGQHLACFAGGMFALGGRLFNIEEHVALGDRLARGCAWAYAQFPAAVMPELFTMIPCKSLDGCGWDENLWDRRLDPTLKKSFTVARDTRYILRPEAAESLFLLYRITGNQELQDLAWRMFKAILAATDAPLGNSAIADVRVLPWETIKTDSMEVSAHGPFFPHDADISYRVSGWPRPSSTFTSSSHRPTLSAWTTTSSTRKLTPCDSRLRWTGRRQPLICYAVQDFIRALPEHHHTFPGPLTIPERNYCRRRNGRLYLTHITPTEPAATSHTTYTCTIDPGLLG
jgi:mannosyl-oligosaccharide alpha-1,2-mannosidase